jgi:regulator of protease activity HflC (stomatin/prohibitin superfamily)
MSTLMWVVLVFAAALSLFIAYLVLRPSLEIVPEGEQLVIYRLGHFHRIAGPGPVRLFLMRDEIQQRLDVRNKPVSLSVSGIFLHDIGMEIGLNLWYSFNPQRAAAGDRTTLVQWVLVREPERYHQVEIKIRQALVNSIAAVDRDREAPRTLIDKILPVIPGTPLCDKVLRNMANELEETLPTLGITLDRRYPINITSLLPPEDVIKSLGRDRVFGALRQRFPDLSDDKALQMVGAIEGLKELDIKRFIIEGSADTSVEERILDKDTMTRVVTSSPRQTQPADQPAEGAFVGPKANPARTRLTASDLAVLKRVPRDDNPQKRAA